MKTTEELTEEVFTDLEADLGRAHVSEGMGVLLTPSELFSAVRNNLFFARKVVEKYEAFLDKYSQRDPTSRGD